MGAADAVSGNAPSDRFRPPRIGLSDEFDYGGRPLRAHAVAQLTSLLDALGISGRRSSAPRWAGCGRSVWRLTRQIGLPPWRRSESPPSRCPACTATRSSPRSPHLACASSPRGSAHRTSRRHAGRWPAASSALAPPSERLTGSSRSSTRVCASPAFGRDAQPHAARDAARPAPPGELPLGGRTAAAHGARTHDLGRRGPLRRPRDRRTASALLPERGSRSSQGATPPSSTTLSAAAR